MIYKYLQTINVSFIAVDGPAANTFPDFSSVAAYARDPMDFATRRYYIAGSGGYLKPKDILTRNQIAAICKALCAVAYRT